jgi:hypothetical protein
MAGRLPTGRDTSAQPEAGRVRIEDYALIGDVAHQRLVGNFPQAFTRLTLVAAAKTLANPSPDAAARYVDPQAVRHAHAHAHR